MSDRQDGVSLGIVKTIAKRESMKIAGTTIQSITFDREENDLYYYNILLTNGSTVVLTVPVNTNFTNLHMLMASSSNNNDNGNFRLNVVSEDNTTKLIIERRQAGSWVRAAEIGSLESDRIIVEDLSGAILYRDGSGELHTISKPSVTGQGAVFGDPQGKITIVSNGTNEVVKIDDTSILSQVLNSGNTVTQSGSLFTIPFTTTRVEAFLTGTIELANVPANTKMRASLTDSSGNDIGESVTTEVYADGNGQDVADGDVTATILVPFAVPNAYNFNLKLEFTNSVDLLGDNIDLLDTRGERFVPKLTLTYYEGTECALTDSNNVGEHANALTGDNRVSYNSLKDTPSIPSEMTTEQVQDIVGAMVSGNTETGIEVTYDDTNGKLNFVVSGVQPPQASHTNYLAVTDDNQASSVDTATALSSDDLNPSFTIPTFTGNKYLQILQSMAHTRFNTVAIGGINQIGAMTINDSAVTISGQSYRQYVSTNMVTDVLSGNQVVTGGAS